MKSQKQTEEGTPSFHRFVLIEITETILSRLPVKTLIRFQSVSKSWRATISDPRFRRIQYDTTQSNAPLRTLYFDDSHDFIHLVRVQNKNLVTECALESPFDKYSSQPGATCNGVVLMVKFRDNNFTTVFALWNPSIRKHSDWIRRPPFDVKFSTILSYGLYHDPTTDDYKIAIVYDKYYDVYSCKSRSWRGAKAFPNPGRTSFNVNGSSCFYWQDEDDIFRFDVSDGKLSKIPLPDKFPPPLPDTEDEDEWGESVSERSITMLSGRLGLVISEWNYWTVGVWVMEERDNSWTEVVSSEGDDDDDCEVATLERWAWRPCLVTDEGDLVVTTYDYYKKNELRMFDCVEKSLKKLEGVEGKYGNMLPYSESLYFPDS